MFAGKNIFDIIWIALTRSRDSWLSHFQHFGFNTWHVCHANIVFLRFELRNGLSVSVCVECLLPKMQSPIFDWMKMHFWALCVQNAFAYHVYSNFFWLAPLHTNLKQRRNLNQMYASIKSLQNMVFDHSKALFCLNCSQSKRMRWDGSTHDISGEKNKVLKCSNNFLMFIRNPESQGNGNPQPCLN